LIKEFQGNEQLNTSYICLNNLYLVNNKYLATIDIIKNWENKLNFQVKTKTKIDS
jgi:hypothetical protein